MHRSTLSAHSSLGTSPGSKVNAEGETEQPPAERPSKSVDQVASGCQPEKIKYSRLSQENYALRGAHSKMSVLFYTQHTEIHVVLFWTI